MDIECTLSSGRYVTALSIAPVSCEFRPGSRPGSRPQGSGGRAFKASGATAGQCLGRGNGFDPRGPRARRARRARAVARAVAPALLFRTIPSDRRR